MKMRKWASVFFLATMTASSVSAPAVDLGTTTDAAIERVEEAARLDVNFIKTDLQDFQLRYADTIRASYLSSVGKIAVAMNKTYEGDIPEDVTEYNLSCLEGIYDDVQERMEDLDHAVAVCANQSNSATKVDRNLVQFQTITSSLGEFSGNLTTLINECLVKYPKISWDRLQCVLDQVEVLTSQFDPVFSQFKVFNVVMNGHLMLLGLDMSLCSQQAIQQLAQINKAILRDIDTCKMQRS